MELLFTEHPLMAVSLNCVCSPYISFRRWKLLALLKGTYQGQRLGNLFQATQLEGGRVRIHTLVSQSPAPGCCAFL